MACSRNPGGEAVSEAETFFKELSSGQFDAAYQRTSFQFKSEQTQAGFEAKVRELNLLNAQPVQWSQQTLSDNSAKIQGTLFNGQARMEALIRLSKQAGAWKIISLKISSNEKDRRDSGRFSFLGAGADFLDLATLEVPAEVELRKLVLESLLNFNKAIQQKSWKIFYDSVSDCWQRQLTEKRLSEAYGGWREMDVDFGIIKELKANFTEPPVVNSKGLLLIRGYYPTYPQRLDFKLQFVYEMPKWKLLALEVSLADLTLRTKATKQEK